MSDFEHIGEAMVKVLPPQAQAAQGASASSQDKWARWQNFRNNALAKSQGGKTFVSKQISCSACLDSRFVFVDPEWIMEGEIPAVPDVSNMLRSNRDNVAIACDCHPSMEPIKRFADIFGYPAPGSDYERELRFARADIAAGRAIDNEQRAGHDYAAEEPEYAIPTF